MASISLMYSLFRRAPGSAEQFLRANWEPSNEHLALMSGETVVGTMMRQVGGTLGDCWFWPITCVLTDDTPMTGRPTHEEAQA